MRRVAFHALRFKELPGGCWMYNLTQKLIAEFTGTFALIFFGAGAVCVDMQLRTNATGGIGLLAIALAYGLAIAILVSARGRISGGHFNPAVTIGFWVTKKLSTMDTLFYWLAQLAGAAAAAFLLRSVIPEEVWRSVALGTPELMRDFPSWAGLALEATTTFFLVFVVFATAVDERGAFRAIAGFGIGLTMTLGIVVAGPETGAGFNPGRAFWPAVAAGHWLYRLFFRVGPMGGGFLAGLVYDSGFLKPSEG